MTVSASTMPCVNSNPTWTIDFHPNPTASSPCWTRLARIRISWISRDPARGRSPSAPALPGTIDLPVSDKPGDTPSVATYFGSGGNEHLPAPRAGGLYNCRRLGRFCRGLSVPSFRDREGRFLCGLRHLYSFHSLDAPPQ